MNKNTPYYIAKIHLVECFTDIRINDVPLHKGAVPGQYSLNSPINHLLLSSGIHSVSATMLPLPGQTQLSNHARCIIEILLCDISTELITPVANVVQFDTDENEQTIAQLPVITKTFTFSVDVPYSISRWSDCIDLDNIQSLRDIVVAFYKKVASMLNNHDFAGYTNLIREREKEIAEALYLSEETVKARSQQVPDLIQEGFEVMPITGLELMPIYANGKIVTLLNTDMTSALQLQNKETGDVAMINLWLGIRQGTTILSVI